MKSAHFKALLDLFLSHFRARKKQGSDPKKGIYWEFQNLRGWGLEHWGIFPKNPVFGGSAPLNNFWHAFCLKYWPYFSTLPLYWDKSSPSCNLMCQPRVEVERWQGGREDNFGRKCISPFFQTSTLPLARSCNWERKRETLLTVDKYNTICQEQNLQRYNCDPPAHVELEEKDEWCT